MPRPTEIRGIAGAHARARWDAITVGAPNAQSSHGPAGAWCDAGREVAGVAEPGPQFGVMPRQTSGGVVARRSIQQGGNLHVDDAAFLKDPLAFGEQPGNQHAGALSQAFELDAALARRDDVATNTPVLRAWCVPFPLYLSISTAFRERSWSEKVARAAESPCFRHSQRCHTTLDWYRCLALRFASGPQSQLPGEPVVVRKRLEVFVSSTSFFEKGVEGLDPIPKHRL